MLTKEEFQQGIKAMIDDIKDPNGEFADIRKDFDDLYQDLSPHDAELATHMAEIMHAMDRMIVYVQNRTS